MNFRGVVMFTATLLLAGCAIPELVAHGVKEIEKSNRSSGASQAPASAPSAQARAEEEPPPPSAPAAARRSSVTVEELPAR